MTAPDDNVSLDRLKRSSSAAGIVLMSVLTLLLVGIVARVGQLQVAPGEALAEHMDGRTTRVSEPGVRGDLRDRRGRLIAASRFGYRVFVDPMRFPNPPGDAMLRLSDATGVPVEEIAERLVPRMAENERRLAQASSGAPVQTVSLGRGEGDAEPEPLIRYVSIGGVLEDWRVDSVRAAGIDGVYLEVRAVRESFADGLADALVGKVGVDHDGLLGAELMVDSAMSPEPGTLRFVRDAFSRPMWMDPDSYRPPTRGRDVRLSIDLELQRIAQEELERGIERCDAAGGRLVMIDPATGEVLAMVDMVREVPGAVALDFDNPPEPGGPWVRYRTIPPDPRREVHPALGRNRCVEDVYEPGSTFKSFMWSAATELGCERPETVIDTGGGAGWRTPYGRHIEDVTERDEQTWTEILVNSSNVGMVKVTSRMTEKQMRDFVLAFGFGRPTNLGLPGESPGLVTSQKDWTHWTQTSVAFGNEVAVTPLQMVRAFSVFARTQEDAGTLPGLRLTAMTPEESRSGVRVRVLRPETARLTRETLRGVVDKLEKKLHEADPTLAPARYALFGKSGTAMIPVVPPEGKRRPRGMGYYPEQYNSSFIAGGPAEDPRLVVLVVIDDPGPKMRAVRQHYGSWTAGPVVRSVMERSLAYLNVPPSTLRQHTEARVAEGGWVE